GAAAAMLSKDVTSTNLETYSMNSCTSIFSEVSTGMVRAIGFPSLIVDRLFRSLSLQQCHSRFSYMWMPVILAVKQHAGPFLGINSISASHSFPAHKMLWMLQKFTEMRNTISPSQITSRSHGKLQA